VLTNPGPTNDPQPPGSKQAQAVPATPSELPKKSRISDAALTYRADESTDLRSLVEEYNQNPKAADDLYRGRSLAVWPCWVIGSTKAADGRLVAQIGYAETSVVAICYVAAGKDTEEFLARTGKKAAAAIVGKAGRPQGRQPVLLDARAVFVGRGADIARWVDYVRR
jgi:hypothetical protein